MADVTEQRRARTLRLFTLQRGRCYLCLDEMGILGRHPSIEHFSPTRATIDRIMPGKRGGRYLIGNIALACRACNILKGHRAPTACEQIFGWSVYPPDVVRRAAQLEIGRQLQSRGVS